MFYTEQESSLINFALKFQLCQISRNKSEKPPANVLYHYKECERQGEHPLYPLIEHEKEFDGICVKRE